MTTPFDNAIAAVAAAKYHNHRLEDHSDVVCDGIVADLSERCPSFRSDLESGVVRIWKNVASPGDRLRRVDLFVGEPDQLGRPVIEKVRIAVENKSVITAHRNRTNRFDDLKKVVAAVEGARPTAVLVATVLIGLADRVLNVPDRVRTICRTLGKDFEQDVLPRLSSGDETLFVEFSEAISRNSLIDPAKTMELFRTLPLRGAAETHKVAYDALLLVPVWVDNVHGPLLPRPNSLGIDVDRDYARMIQHICAAYTARWHM